MTKNIVKLSIEERQELLNEIMILREPYLQDAQIAFTAAAALGQNIIKSGMILNGGALVALPAIASMFQSSYLQSSQTIFKYYLVAAAIAYVFGLLCAWLSNIVAYFVANAVQNVRMGELQQTHINAIHARIDLQLNSYKELMEQVQMQTRTKEYNIQRFRIVCLCFGSLLSFIAGSILSGIAFYRLTSL